MIDVESEVFSRIKAAVTIEVPDINMVSESANIVKKFPCVFLYESDNYANEATATTSDSENHAELMYTVEVYSNKSGLKKSECKKIMSIIDREFSNIGFTRISMQPIPNQPDGALYRIVARYRAVVSKDKTIYRR